MTQPRVGVVIVNYHGGDRTIACVRAVLESTWPRDLLRVVVVDNGDERGFATQLRAAAPEVELVRTPSNLGFAGGANTGIRALSDCDVVALVNNDATPEPGWLGPLVDATTTPRVGAATPKVVLDRTFLSVDITVEDRKVARGDPRPLGVQLSGVRVDGQDVLEDCYLRSGFWGWETDLVTVGGRFAWTADVASLLVPAEHAPALLELRLSNGLGDVAVELSTGAGATTVLAEVHPAWHAVPAGLAPRRVVNNAGTVLLPGGRTADRGFLELDDGRFDAPQEVFGFSAAAVVLSRPFLDDVGTLDDRFFLYYEDADLSWRGRLRGWTYAYVPQVEVRHEHSATVGRASALAEHLAARNRLLMLTRCAPRDLLVAALRRHLADLLAALGRDVLLRPLRAKRPAPEPAVRQARVLVGYLRLLPTALLARRSIRRRSQVADEEILAWVDAGGQADLRFGRS